MDFYHRTNYGQNEPVNKAILTFLMNIVACLVFVMMKVGMFFVMASVALCLESGHI
jgi:RsiW-degrading membrane proteinase PrsW (M82 family)